MQTQARVQHSSAFAPQHAAAAAPAPVVEVEHVSKHYGERVAVSDVSFSIAPGQVVALVGPNGAGKSTLVEIMVGLRRADRGRVSVFGSDTADPRRPYAARIGVQLQQTGFFPSLTARDYLRFFQRVYPRSVDLDQLVRELDLGRFLDQRMNKLSGGQRQRIALALALVNDPDFIILDEPTVGLDPIARRAFWQLLRRVHDDGARTLLFSTHYMEEAEALASHVLMLAHGRILAAGPIRDVVAAAGAAAATLDDAYTALVGMEQGALA
jgi:ABC-2 type transport system ATP-binding protein